MFFWTDLINVHKHVDSTSYSMTTAVCNTHDSVYMINLHKQFTPFLPHAMLRLRLSKDTHTHTYTIPHRIVVGVSGPRSLWKWWRMESPAAEMSLIIAKSRSLVSRQDSEDCHPPSVACLPSIPPDPFLLSATHTTPAQLHLAWEGEGRGGKGGGGMEWEILGGFLCKH